MDLVSPVVQRWVQDARENPEAFWGRAAAQLPWLRTWDRVFEWTPPTFRWFIGGPTKPAHYSPRPPAQRRRGGQTPPVPLHHNRQRPALYHPVFFRPRLRAGTAARGPGRV